MSHPEKCIICNGTGKLKRDEEEWIVNPPRQKFKKCYGCNGLGWITIHDLIVIPPKSPWQSIQSFREKEKEQEENKG